MEIIDHVLNSPSRLGAPRLASRDGRAQWHYEQPDAIIPYRNIAGKKRLDGEQTLQGAMQVQWLGSDGMQQACIRQ